MKGIEIGGSVGVALGGIGRGVGSAVATGIRVGPCLPGPSRIGIGSYVPEMVREGPAKAADFAGFKRIGPVEAKLPKLGENTMPTKGELRFNHPKKGPGFAEPVQSQDALISEVEAFLAQVRVSPKIQEGPAVAEKPSIKKEHRLAVPKLTQVEEVLPRKATTKLVGPTWGIVPQPELEKEHKVKLEKATLPAPEKVKPVIVLGSQPKIEAETSSQTATSTQPATKEVEEIVEEKVLLNQKEEVKSKAKDEKDSSVLTVKIVEAKEIAQKREWQIKAAVRRVVGKITGDKVGKALSAAYWQLISLVPGLRHDYTLDLTVAEIESDPTEYEGPEQAGEACIRPVRNNTPIKQGEDGRVVTVEEFRKVTTGENTPVASGVPAEILVRRIIKKTVEVGQAGLSTKPVAEEEQTEIKGEISLRELSPKLAEVFQKAA